jgi:starch phosphorylase
VVDLIQSGYFSPGDLDLFHPLVDNRLHQDPFMLLADYQSYVDCQDRVAEAYRDRER